MYGKIYIINLMNLGKYICHRKPERSFFYRNHQFPICARCTGFYLGLTAYLILNCFYQHEYNSEMLILSMVLMLPAGTDGITQYFSNRESTNLIRVTTGFIGGIGLIMFLKIILKNLI